MVKWENLKKEEEQGEETAMEVEVELPQKIIKINTVMSGEMISR